MQRKYFIDFNAKDGVGYNIGNIGSETGIENERDITAPTHH